jgi:hypothetical protein
LQVPSLLTKVGSPTIVPTNQGLAYNFGSGNYFSAAPGVLPDSNGGGNQVSACRAVTVSFVLTSVPTSESIVTVGTSTSDNSPLFAIYIQSGALRYYDGTNAPILDSAPVVGRQYTVRATYSDFAPYTQNVYVNGILAASYAAYRSGIRLLNLYIGVGNTGAATASKVLYAQVELGQSNLSGAYSDFATTNPWAIFAPKKAIFIPASAGGAAIVASGTAVTSGTANVTYTYNPPIVASGVAVTSGTANVTYTYNPPIVASGVAVTSGTANVTYTYNPPIVASGVAVTSGTANVTIPSNPAIVASGTAVTSGTANVTIPSNPAIVASGTAVTSGTANFGLNIAFSASGTAVTSGTANLTNGIAPIGFTGHYGDTLLTACITVGTGTLTYINSDVPSQFGTVYLYKIATTGGAFTASCNGGNLFLFDNNGHGVIGKGSIINLSLNAGFYYIASAPTNDEPYCGPDGLWQPMFDNLSPSRVPPPNSLNKSLGFWGGGFNPNSSVAKFPINLTGANYASAS